MNSAILIQTAVIAVMAVVMFRVFRACRQMEEENAALVNLLATMYLAHAGESGLVIPGRWVRSVCKCLSAIGIETAISTSPGKMDQLIINRCGDLRYVAITGSEHFV